MPDFIEGFNFKGAISIVGLSLDDQMYSFLHGD